MNECITVVQLISPCFQSPIPDPLSVIRWFAIFGRYKQIGKAPASHILDAGEFARDPRTKVFGVVGFGSRQLSPRRTSGRCRPRASRLFKMRTSR